MHRADVRSRRRLLDDFFKVDEAEVSFERPDGSMTPPVRRLVFERGDAVAAVVLHRETQRLLFTEQFRFPTLGKSSGWLLEVAAGMVDPGETPEAALARELEEELGHRAAHMEPIAQFFVSPGGSSERVWLYYAEVGEDTRVSDGGGVSHEHEAIRIVSLSPDEARAALRDGRWVDAKTIIGLQWYFARADATQRRSDAG